MFPILLFAQDKKQYYSDIILDASGQPVIGATVKLLRLQKAVTTDTKGYFRIEARDGDYLTISSIGMQTKVVQIKTEMLHSDCEPLQAPVKPVLSKDYEALVQQYPLTPLFDTMQQGLQVKGNIYAKARKINVKNGTLTIHPDYPKYLAVNGIFSTSIEIKTVNRLPDLQTAFVQGSSQNGQAVWRGAETNEIFSYGPAVAAMQFDGSNYMYDVNGRLTKKGNGIEANVYDNTVLRTASLFTQSLSLQANLVVKHQYYQPAASFKLKFSQGNENTFIKQNTNSNKNFSTSLAGAISKTIMLTGSYHYAQDKFTHLNRNGFLNRVYQNALLTPVSFDNLQATRLGNNQRSYSSFADNPNFLLDNNNGFVRSQNNTGLVLEKNKGTFKFKVSGAFENSSERSNESYQPGTAYFTNGIDVLRIKNSNHWFVHVNATNDIVPSGPFNATVTANYIYNNTATGIAYNKPFSSYHYQRASHDVSLLSIIKYKKFDTQAGLQAGNKFYLSNTSSNNAFFLPSINMYSNFDKLFNNYKLRLKVVAGYAEFNSELPVDQSFAHTSLLRLTTEQAPQYLPMQEVTGFNQLSPVRHKEWKTRLELSYNYRFTASAEFFSRTVSDDVFAVNENNLLALKNIASHRSNGIELQVMASTGFYNSKKIKTDHSLSFLAYNSMVTGVTVGYNNTPIAGFANVNKAIVQGEALGVITGNGFLKDAKRKVVIGADGFPLSSQQRSVLGNPIPDFVLKMSHAIQWKNLSLNIDWEWKKGGDIWNGTQAVLDYYGRSQKTADQRNTTGYIFNGVQENGQANNIPVSFYNTAQPIENNRWVRYGHSGVAEEYIQDASHLRLNTLALAYRFNFKKYIKSITATAYLENLILWTAYNGADPNRLLYDQPNTTGMDFFNLPSTKTFGCNISIQF